jgi:hydrogenase maturation factor HypF (carbamoyltransferase family)
MLVAAELSSPIDLEFGPELDRLLALARKPKLAPQTTSVGRMFDAVSALTGLCRRSRYRGARDRDRESAGARSAVG